MQEEVEKTKIHVLMIEDDQELSEILKEFLENVKEEDSYFEVDVADDPYMGISKMALTKYDVVILDLSLPGMDGLEVCQDIRKKYITPIIISSARSDIQDKEDAFRLGADDYIPKPYDPRELVARIKGHLSRIEQIRENERGGKNKILEYDELKREVYLKGDKLELTNAEFDILKYLISKGGAAVSREELIYNCPSIKEESSNKSIDVIISRIRGKIGDDSKQPNYIQAIRGIGYKLIQ